MIDDVGMKRKQRLENNVVTLKEMREVMVASENWEKLKRQIEACTSGAMALQRIIKEDFGEQENEDG